MNEHIVLIGAGSASFTRGLLADLIMRGTPCDLALVDNDLQALTTAEQLARKMVAARQVPITIRASTNRRDVLQGATAIICTVGVGGRRAWEQDVFIPRQYGIYQPVGDSVMPGGTSRALRMIPAMVAIAEDVLDLAPTALFFNYGNPMAPVCRAIRKATGANVVGLCHGVISVARRLAKWLEVEQDRLRYSAVGMNHLTWFTELRIDGKDALPRLREIGRAKLAEGTENIENPFTWELLELFNAFPAVLDRHITEFFPWMFHREGSHYGKTLGVETFSFEETISAGDAGFAEMCELARSASPLPADYFDRFGGEHEQVTDIIDAIRHDSELIFSANLPNTGQVPNLPRDAIIESPAVADGSGLHPLALPPMSPGLAGTLSTRLQWVETVVDAALTGSRTQFIQALLIDGAVTSIDQATHLADDLLTAQAEYLPQFTA